MKLFTGTAAEWNELLARRPGPHLLQTWEWSQIKAGNGWEPMPFIWPGQAGDAEPAAVAMLLRKPLPRMAFPARTCVLYCPKGPLMDWSDGPLRAQVLEDLEGLAERQRAAFLKIDPDAVLAAGVPRSPGFTPTVLQAALPDQMRARRWRFSSDQIQFKNTVVVDLRFPEEALLGNMKPKTRYNIRLAEKKGVSIRAGTSADLALLYRMFAQTSARDGFVVRDEPYYQGLWRSFLSAEPRPAASPWCEPLVAEVEGTVVAAIIVFYFGRRAYYLYGMSTELHRDRMPNHLLQWEAIRRARANGCEVYDLWGAPDRFEEGDRMWGVFRFKEGFGGQVVVTLGAWDYPPSAIWYALYQVVASQLSAVSRLKGNRRTRRLLQD